MRQVLRPLALLAATSALTAVAVAKVPFTNRTQYNLVPDSVMRSVGKTTYQSMLGDMKVKSKGEDSQTLNKVGRKISKVANQPKYDWDYTLIASDEVNAWCLPGGYIGFYTGILPTLENEAGMAFVMGHEVGHAVAHHGAERLTQQLTLVGGLFALDLYLKDKSKLDANQRALVVGALGVGGAVGVLLPFSRMHESEADVIGMMYMSKAGYPPAESIKVWDRMGKKSDGMPIPAFLSTHPTNKKRQENLREWLPQAKKRYERNALSYDTLQPLWGKAAKGDDPAPSRGTPAAGGGKGGKEADPTPSTNDGTRTVGGKR